MDKRESGRLGGITTYRKYGSEHMSKIGRLGGIAFWKKYRIVPINSNDFMILNREDDTPLNKTMLGETLP